MELINKTKTESATDLKKEQEFAQLKIHQQKVKVLSLVTLVLVLLLLSFSGVWAYQVLSSRVAACQPSDTKVCYEAISGADGKQRVQINNLPAGKIYRFSIKRQLDGGKLADVGQVTVNKTEAAKKCTDTDSGMDYFKKGAVKSDAQTSTSTDTCKSNELTEYYCEGDSIKTTIRFCSGGCQDGACLTDAAPVQPNPIPTPSPNTEACTDTDGLNFYFKGFVSYNNDRFGDSCQDANTVIEKYCLNETLSEVPQSCVSGQCVDGACTKVGHGEMCFGDNGCGAGLICKRSGRYPGDGSFGTDLSQAERYCCAANECASVIPGSPTDQLVDMASLAFPHCIGDNWTDDPMRPSGGKLICRNGVYEEMPPCYDGDGGKNYTVKSRLMGQTAATALSPEDNCLDANTLDEYYCVGDNVEHESYNCSYPYGCEQGMCKLTY